jgi:hypothetical protein
MTTAITYAGSIEVMVCWCGIRFGVPSELAREAYDRAHRIFCPLGHSCTWQETEEKRLRRQIKLLEQTQTVLNARLDTTERSRRAYKGQVSNLKKRVTAGLCPFGCRRHFTNLERHVETQHAGAELPGTPVDLA